MEAVDYGKGWKTYFTQAPNEIFDSRCSLTPIQAMTYLYLLRCVNEKRSGYTAYPSYAIISDGIRASSRAIQDAVLVLIEKGYVFKKNRNIEKGVMANAKTSNMYLINHPTYSSDFTAKTLEIAER